MNLNHERRYGEELAALSSHVHGRNAVLVRLALLGLRAGRTPAELLEEIVAAGGEPQLTEHEVKRAIGAAERHFSAGFAGSVPTRGVRQGALFAGAKLASKRKPNELEQGFVRKMIVAGKGTKSRDLIKLSPFHKGSVPTKIGVGRTCAAFLRTLFRPGELVFAGMPFLPRTRENLKTVEELIEEVSRPWAVPPTHIVPNPFTGQAGLNSEGEESYCLDSTVAHRRMALIEFDDLPLGEQAAFWAGVIRERVLPVRSLVYSGAKSIHGLVELKEAEDGAARETSWTEQWAVIERLMCSDDDPAFRADRACKNASRMTRFPGAVRPETGHRQILIYLDAVE